MALLASITATYCGRYWSRRDELVPLALTRYAPATDCVYTACSAKHDWLDVLLCHAAFDEILPPGTACRGGVVGSATDRVLRFRIGRLPGAATAASRHRASRGGTLSKLEGEAGAGQQEHPSAAIDGRYEPRRLLPRPRRSEPLQRRHKVPSWHIRQGCRCSSAPIHVVEPLPYCSPGCKRWFARQPARPTRRQMAWRWVMAVGKIGLAWPGHDPRGVPRMWSALRDAQRYPRGRRLARVVPLSDVVDQPPARPSRSPGPAA